MALPSPPLGGLTFSLVGPGRVGSSLACWLVESGASLVEVAGRSEPTARALATRLGGQTAALASLGSENEDLLLIAVSDSALAGVAATLARHPQAKVALHTSGHQSAAVLHPLGPQGTATGSLHPLMAYPDILPAASAAAGSVFAVDGEPEAQQMARRLVTAWSGEAVEIPAESRPLYHLAASLAAGGVVTLLATACNIASSAGLPAAVGRGYLELALGALDQTRGLADPAAAITGPVARGDLETLEIQLRRLREADPERAALVATIARETLRHRQQRGELDSTHEALENFLDAFPRADKGP
ncbi:MAG: DUF2520 domain-containing protein [Acidobacteria bacterium]|nr:MAG: DUF2520 domain-containing protein [Acidobacteriota bacterium]